MSSKVNMKSNTTSFHNMLKICTLAALTAAVMFNTTAFAKGLSVGSKKEKIYIAVDVKVVDAETGEIADAKKVPNRPSSHNRDHRQKTAPSRLRR